MNDGYNYPDCLYADHLAKQTPTNGYDARQSVNPKHYALGSGQAIDVIESVAATISDPVQATLTSHALKYLLRWSRKGGITDLLKCRWYLARLIGKVESANQEAAQTVTPSEPDYSDNAYLARFGPNTLAPEASRHPMAAEADRILKGQPGDML